MFGFCAGPGFGGVGGFGLFLIVLRPSECNTDKVTEPKTQTSGKIVNKVAALGILLLRI